MVCYFRVDKIMRTENYIKPCRHGFMPETTCANTRLVESRDLVMPYASPPEENP